MLNIFMNNLSQNGGSSIKRICRNCLKLHACWFYIAFHLQNEDNQYQFNLLLMLNTVIRNLTLIWTGQCGNRDFRVKRNCLIQLNL